MKRQFLSRVMQRVALMLLVLALAIFLLLVPIHHSAAQQQRAQSRQLQQTVTSWPSKSKRWALVIGVDQYRDGNISPLRGAANDAAKLARALTDYADFPSDQVILLATDQPEERQPTRINILTYLSNLSSAVPKDGLLLVAFAGHGIERGGQAYLIPSDARLTDDISLLEESAISVERMHQRIRAAQVAQVVVLLDACRNDPGGRADAPNPLTQAYVRGFNFDVRNREVQAFATIYATAVGQRAYEYQEKKQGYFTWAVVEGLKGAAANEKGEVTLSSLVKYVQEVVPKRIAIDLGMGKQQRPFAVIEGYRADELVVAVSAPPSAATNASTTTSRPSVTLEDVGAVEAEYWETIKNSTNAADYQEYLKEYPQGRYAQLARLKLRQMDAKKEDFDSPYFKGLNMVNGRDLKDLSDGELSAALNYFLRAEGGTHDAEAKRYADRLGKEFDRRRHLDKPQPSSVSVPRAGVIVRNQIGMEFGYVPAGTFMMGSENGQTWEKPVHQVTIREGFYMGRYEVTQAQWQQVMGSNPSYFKNCDQCPVEQVSWNDAQEFIQRLNAHGDGFIYRLPSEAEWEYACRAGRTGDFTGNLDLTAWYGNNSGQRYLDAAEIWRQYPNTAFQYIAKNGGKTHPAGQKQPNAFGIYDMYGNVWEWCADYYHENYNGSPNDGSPWLMGGASTPRVMRGRSWVDDAAHIRSTDRSGVMPDVRTGTNYGFRVVATSRQ